MLHCNIFLASSSKMEQPISAGKKNYKIKIINLQKYTNHFKTNERIQKKCTPSLHHINLLSTLTFEGGGETVDKQLHIYSFNGRFDLFLMTGQLRFSNNREQLC